MAKRKIDDWIQDGRLIPERREVLETWARNGLTMEEIARNMQISKSTLQDWAKKYQDISSALKNARAHADAHVENALFQKAIGCTKTLKKPIKVRRWRVENGKKVGEEEVIEYADEEVYIPPDMGAIAFFLKNRMPDKWKDRRIEVPDEDKDEAGMICMRLLRSAEKTVKEAGSD